MAVSFTFGDCFVPLLPSSIRIPDHAPYGHFVDVGERADRLLRRT